MKGRGWIAIIILFVLAAAVYLWLRNNRQAEETATLPLDLYEVIPADWGVLPQWQLQCSFDDDSDLEWLIVYRYDQTQVPQPYTEGVQIGRGPIGGAIFDAQNNVVPAGGGNPSPYASTFVIPYRLLPDFYGDKGQGYLGETSVNVLFNPPMAGQNAAGQVACRVNEITVLGYADSPLPTRLSVFRWQNAAAGYAGAHFAGDARIDVTLPVDQPVAVQQLTTYNRLDNHRSLLCTVQQYNRMDSDSVTFQEDLAAVSVDFCFNAPPDAAYPEGVVVAYVRGANQGKRPDSDPPPTDGYRLVSAQGLDAVPTGPTVRILSLTNPAGVYSDPAGGHGCRSDEIEGGIDPAATPEPNPTPTAGGWICGRETATVETEIVSQDGAPVRRVVWQLISIIPEEVNSDVYWRIQSAQVAAP